MLIIIMATEFKKADKLAVFRENITEGQEVIYYDRLSSKEFKAKVLSKEGMDKNLELMFFKLLIYDYGEDGDYLVITCELNIFELK